MLGATALFVVVVAIPPVQVRTASLWRTLRRRHMPDVLSLRDRYELNCMFQRALLEHRGQAGTGASDRELRLDPVPVMHAQLHEDSVRVEHDDGSVLRLVGVDEEAARGLVEAVALHRVELIEQAGSILVFRVTPYSTAAHDEATLLRLHARQVLTG